MRLAALMLLLALAGCGQAGPLYLPEAPKPATPARLKPAPEPPQAAAPSTAPTPATPEPDPEDEATTDHQATP